MPTFIQLVKHSRKPKKYKNKRLDLRRCPQKKGTCIKAFKTTPRKPNSALRKVAFIHFRHWKWNVLVYVPGDRTKANDKHPLQRFSVVLVRGGRVKDIPGLKYTAICGKFDLPSLELRNNARSKFGVRKKKKSFKIYKKFHYN